MSISYQIPHTARPIFTSNTAVGVYNIPTIGKYDFETAANTDQKIIDLQIGTIYLIERINVGGNIAEGDYLDNIDVLPLIALKYKVAKEIVYQKPFPVSNYIDNKPIVTWIRTQKQDDELQLTMTGQLNQNASLVGIQQVKLYISYTIYAIDSTDFANRFENKLGGNVGQQVRGGL